jgi:hypothetical protein
METMAVEQKQTGWKSLRFTFQVMLFALMAGPGTGKLSAELPPYVYREMQEDADYNVKIEVVTVDRSLCILCEYQDIRVLAKVRAISRSSGSLEAGRIIRIEYRHHNPEQGWVGPSPIPVLREGSLYPAWLNLKDKIFVPAARGYSFEPLVIIEE